MKVLSFLSHEDLAEFMIEMALDEGKTSYAVLFYEDARQLLKELSAYEETIIDNIELSEPISKGYSKEFYVVLDTDLHLTVEEAWHDENEYHEGCYYRFGDRNVLALIHSDANSKVISAADGSDCYEIEITEIPEEDFDIDAEIDLFDFLEYLVDHLESISEE